MKVDSGIDVEEDMPFCWSFVELYFDEAISICLSNKNMENRVNKIHERALRLVYDESQYLPFEELLVKGNSLNIHQKISKL